MLIALTGANGFLGKHILTQAIESGNHVVAFVRSKEKLSEFTNNSSVTIVEESYTDISTFSNKLKNLTIELGLFDLFIHNAGLTKSLDSGVFFKVNVDLTKFVCEGLHRLNALKVSARLVYISSLAAQGPKNADGPVSAYGKSKLKAENIIKNSGFNYVIYRPTGIYGPDDLAFLPMFKSAKFGFHFDLSQKNQNLTLILGNDLAKLIIKAHKYPDRFIVRCSDGNVYTQKDLAETFTLVFKKKVRYLRIHPSIAIYFLWLSDKYSHKYNKIPEVTLEKYREISQDWDVDALNEHTPEDVDFLSLESGFTLTLRAYQSKSLI
ncbi:MAG: NAD(P)-dependent oxidoreductase [Cyclobacteriaceae bacterium]